MRYDLGMKSLLPPLNDVKLSLSRLTKSELGTLAATSGVPVPTLQKIRYGITENPGYETMRKVLPLVPNHKKREKRGVAKAGVVVHD